MRERATPGSVETAANRFRYPLSATFLSGVLVNRGLACALACALLGCSVYDPALVRRDGGSTGECDPITPPDRPLGMDDGEDVGERVYVIRDVVFDQGGERWRTIGFDLDGRCSQPPDFDVECTPRVSGASPEVDGEGGIDNSFGHNLFPTVDLAVPGLEDVSRMYQARGIGAVLVRITGWNGRDDDVRIDVTAGITVFGTPGTADMTDPPDPTDPMPEPTWDGNDWFWVRSDNFLDGDVTQPLIRDDNAYVSGGVMVIRLPDRSDFIFPGEDLGLLVRLTEAVATARIEGGGSSLSEITVAGRWPMLDLLDTAEAVGVCPGSAENNILRNQLDRIVDVRANSGTGGSVQCDAVSLGLQFEQGVRVRFAGVAPGDPVPDACAMPPMDAGM